MVFGFAILTGVLGILTEFIPSSKSPPRSIIGSASVYDSLHRRIITVGGIDSSTNEQTSNIYAFNLDEKVFEIFYILSDYKPKAYANHATFLRSDRKILCFGFNSGVASFDLNSNSWKQEEMTGNITLDVGSFGFTSFIFDDIEYVAIFGGTSETGIKNDLYLITVHSLFSQILPKNGDFPTPKSFVSMVFYEDALYIYGYTPFSEDIDDSIYKYDLNLEYWSKIEAKGTKPSPRLNAFLYVHNEEMILLYGAYLEFSEFYNELYKYNFKSNTWRQVVNFTGSIIGGSSSVKINNELYILYGRTFDEAKNSIQMIDLDEEIPNPIEITKNFLSPTRRINHCSLVFSHFMYIFGGFYDNHEDPQLIYNDMWKFDLEELIWESIITKGTRPSARKNNACCKQGGSRMFIFGGEDESTYMNDLYFYHQTYDMWYKVTPEGNSISERTGACMTSYLNLLFIVGGKSTDKGNNDLWVFDLETNQYKCLDNGRFYSDLVNSKCWIEESDGDLVSLLVVGGADIYQAVNINQYRISINTKSLTVKDFKVSYSEQDGCFVKENSALINFGNKSIVFGGALNGFVAIFPLIIYDHSNMNCEILNKEEDLVLYGHSAVHYKDAIYVFGGGGVTMFYISLVQIFNNIIKVTFDKDDTIKATCSEGSFGSKCDLCPKGEYMLDKKCKKCPTGTFNNILGSTNIDQCIPCDYGSFSNKPGSNYCYDCFSSYTCPIGSSYPKPKINSLKNATIQPSQYSSDQEYISEMSSLMWYSFGVFFLILLIFALFFQNASLFLKRTDFFVDSHEKPLDVPIVYIKTRIGGVFSLSFLLASCITIVITALNFNYDNIIEIRGTVPLIVLQEKVKSEKLEAEFTFYTYGGECLVNNECNPKITESHNGFKYQDKDLTCLKDNENCKVSIKYSKVELIAKQAEITVKLKEYLSYSSALSVNLSTSSSIPNQISNVFTFFQPPKEDQVFKGFSPNKFYFEFLPSVFTSESTKWPSKETGFHVYLSKEPEIGSLATKESMNIQMHLGVTVVIEESATAMETQRLVRQGWFNLISGLLGSVFGLMGTFGTAMAYFEGLVDKYEKSRNNKMKLKSIVDRTELMKNRFYRFRLKAHHRKIQPILTTMNSKDY